MYNYWRLVVSLLEPYCNPIGARLRTYWNLLVSLLVSSRGSARALLGPYCYWSSIGALLDSDWSPTGALLEP